MTATLDGTAETLDTAISEILNKSRAEITGEEYFKALQRASEIYKEFEHHQRLGNMSTTTDYTSIIDPLVVAVMFTKANKTLSPDLLSYHEQYEGGILSIKEKDEFVIGKGKAYSMLADGNRKGSLVDADFSQFLIQELNGVTYICGGHKDILGIYLPN